jgi:hypothetical protein
MYRLHALVALVVGLALVGGVEAAPKGKKKNKKGNTEVIHGKVEAVHHGKDGTGTITIEVHHHHAKKIANAGSTAKANKANKAAKGGKKKDHDVVVHVLESTKFYKDVHEGKGNKILPASFKDVHKGEHVAVQLLGGKEHDAKSVTIEIQKKGGKKAVARNNKSKSATKKKGKA